MSFNVSLPAFGTSSTLFQRHINADNIQFSAIPLWNKLKSQVPKRGNAILWHPTEDDRSQIKFIRLVNNSHNYMALSDSKGHPYVLTVGFKNHQGFHNFFLNENGQVRGSSPTRIHNRSNKVTEYLAILAAPTSELIKHEQLGARNPALDVFGGAELHAKGTPLPDRDRGANLAMAYQGLVGCRG